MNSADNVREIKEAIVVGERALNSLNRAGEHLNSARNWGIWDMLGGGLLSSALKHSRIGDAQLDMEEAKYQLQQFQKELKDITVPMEFRMEVHGFLTFADFFFDGLIADVMVQSKIQEAREQVEEAIQQVEGIMDNLRSWKREILLEDRGNV